MFAAMRPSSPNDRRPGSLGLSQVQASARTWVNSYDAFISYSHSLDGKLAPALQSALQRFAKPWYRLRSCRVFRDQTQLTASPALWQSLEQALSASRYFVLLASPEAARSPWVNREIEF